MEGVYCDMTSDLMRRYRDVRGTGAQRKGHVKTQEKVAICKARRKPRDKSTCQHLDFGFLKSND